MEALPLAFTTGWASGVNACVLVLGLLGRFADVDDVPTFRAIKRGYARFRAWREKRGNPATRTI